MKTADKIVLEYLKRAQKILNDKNDFNFGLHSDIVVEVAKMIQIEEKA
jgi:hypothetical protein